MCPRPFKEQVASAMTSRIVSLSMKVSVAVEGAGPINWHAGAEQLQLAAMYAAGEEDAACHQGPAGTAPAETPQPRQTGMESCTICIGASARRRRHRE